MFRVIKIIAILLLLIPAAVFSVDMDTVSFNIAPAGILPLGDSGSYFDFGGGVNIPVDLTLSNLPLVFIRTNAGLEFLPIVTKDSLAVFSIQAGGGLKITPSETFSMNLYGTGGYYYGLMTDGSGTGGGGLGFSTGVSASLNLGSAVSLGLGADYRKRTSLYDGLGFSFILRLTPAMFGKTGIQQGGSSLDLLEAHTPGISGEGTDITEVKFKQVFPVLFKYYDTNPVGSVTLFNNEKKPVTDVSVSFYVDRYMDNPKQSVSVPVLQGGDSLPVDLYALFSDSVLDITEGTKVSANIILKYSENKKETTKKYVVSMDLYDRNAITWDDDRKAAAFVTAKDPAVLQLAKNIAGWTRDFSPSAIDRNFCIAMAVHNGLKELGISYQIDPKTPFTEFSEDKLSVDFLQFPRQTLTYSSGDCDDLSILYSALLEAVGIETAFITIPGHIYMAFALKMGSEDAQKAFQNPEDLIFNGERVWMPVEITQVQEPFLTAWATGAREWRENFSFSRAVLYPMHESWNKYAPAGLPGETDLVMPDKDIIIELFRKELGSFIDRQIFPQVARIEELIKRNDDPRYRNRLGVLFGRYGQNKKAEEQFLKALQQTEYVPSLINLGNLKFMGKELKPAMEFYERAAELDPDNPVILLAIARAGHELENYGTVKDSYGKLKEIDPELAERFSYLELKGDEALRAAEADEIREVVIWSEE